MKRTGEIYRKGVLQIRAAFRFAKARFGAFARASANALEVSELRRSSDGYRAAFEALQIEATALRQSSDGYSAAFEALQIGATVLRQSSDGYQGAYEACCAKLASARDERDRLLGSLERLRYEKRTVPSRLGGRQLCFMHIGKTAGTSLQGALFEAMPDAAIFHESLVNFDTVSSVELAINDLVIGHFAYQHVAKMRPDRFLVTFLRDPIERVVSNYYFLRADSPVSSYSATAIEAARKLSLREFCRCSDPGVRMVTENFQAKSLAHDVRPEYQGAIFDLAAEAERNLSTFDFVGIVEYFDDSVAALSRKIGLALSAKKVNVTETRRVEPRPTLEEVELIRRLNKVDIALYIKARKRFERTIMRTIGTRCASSNSADEPRCR